MNSQQKLSQETFHIEQVQTILNNVQRPEQFTHKQTLRDSSKERVRQGEKTGSNLTRLCVGGHLPMIKH